jgi:hypothetical protein
MSKMCLVQVIGLKQSVEIVERKIPEPAAVTCMSKSKLAAFATVKRFFAIG